MTFTRLSNHLSNPKLLAPLAILSVSKVSRPLPLFRISPGHQDLLRISSFLIWKRKITPSLTHTLHCFLHDFEPFQKARCERSGICTIGLLFRTLASHQNGYFVTTYISRVLKSSTSTALDSFRVITSPCFSRQLDRFRVRQDPVDGLTIIVSVEPRL